MNWLILLYFLEFGYSPFYGSLNTLPPDQILVQDEKIFYTTFDAEVVILNTVFIGGAVKTYFQDIINDYSFYPSEVDYIFRAGIRYKNIEIGAKYFCLHPVRPNEMYYQPQGSTDGSYEEFYIRISNEF